MEELKVVVTIARDRERERWLNATRHNAILCHAERCHALEHVLEAIDGDCHNLR